MQIRQTIENMFEAWSEMVIRHPWKILFVTFLFSAALIPQLRHGWLDVSIESFLPQDDPAIIDYNDFRDQFNYAPGAMVIVEIPDGIYTMESLNWIRDFHHAAEMEIPYLYKATSIANVRYTRSEDDMLEVGDLSEIWPETEEDIPAFQTLIRNNPNYHGAVISEDEKVLIFLFEPQLYSMASEPDENGIRPYLQGEEETAFSEAIFKLVDKFNSEKFIVKSGGGPTMNYQVAIDMETSTIFSTSLGMGLIILLLILLFRRASGVLLPLTVVFLSMLMDLALWPTLGFAFNGNTQIIPTFILAVGIADAIHILSIFYKYYDHGVDKLEAISRSVKETAIAVLLTTITTALGLLSFLASDMQPTRTLGIFGSIGVIFAFFYTLALLPSLLAVLPIKKRTIKQHESADNVDLSGEEIEKPSLVLNCVDACIDTFADWGINHAKPIFIGTLIVTALSLAGIAQLKFSHDPVAWYPDEHELPQAVKLADTRMDGTMTAYILIDTKEEYGLYNPKTLKAIEDIEILIESYRYEDVKATEATSINSIVKETNQAWHDNDPNAFIIPDNRELVAQEIFLSETGSDDVRDFTDSQYSLARINLQLPWSNVLSYKEYVKLMKKAVEDKLLEHDMGHMEVKFVGLLPIFGETLYSLLQGTIESYLMAFVLVGFVMYLLMESLRHGLIAFTPNILPIIITVGMIGWMGIPLNLITSTIGCVVIGISVDDTIHFMHHFRRFSQEYDDIKTVIHKTLHTCGRAIFFTSVVLVGGFIVHLTGLLTTNKEFGWLLSIAIVLALLANLIIAPALMTLFWKQKNS